MSRCYEINAESVPLEGIGAELTIQILTALSLEPTPGAHVHSPGSGAILLVPQPTQKSLGMTLGIAQYPSHRELTKWETEIPGKRRLRQMFGSKVL